MRKLALHNALEKAGASFAERYGVEVAAGVSGLKAEYHHIRDAVGLTDFSYAYRYRVPEQTGLDFLDNLVAGNVARVRFGRVLHTFIADEDGQLVADCYIANNDDEFIVLCESLADGKGMETIFGSEEARQAGVEALTNTTVLLGIDGYKAWAVAKELFGVDILGLPYMSIETYQFESKPVRILRCGKTSEFGYLLLVPAETAGALFDKLVDSVKKQGGGVCGTAVHDEVRLEGRFFNIFAEGAVVKDPLALGLQWMIDFDKPKFRGSAAISSRRQDGLSRKIIGVSAEPGCETLVRGARIFNGAEGVADVVASCHSHVLGRRLGLALFPVSVAYSGLKFNLGSADGPVVTTISMPPIMPKSLGVKLDEM